MNPKVRTGFSNLPDGELDLDAANAVAGLTGNRNFVFSDNSLTGFAEAATTYRNSLSALSTGGKAAVLAKNAARKALLPLFSAVAIIVNQQAKGDESKLLSSGIKLAGAKQHNEQPVPLNLQVVNGTNGDIIATVKTSPVGDHGTVFAYTVATNASADPNEWTVRIANGHKITIKGLTPGTAYNFTAAYKGLDSEPLVWAPPVKKIVSN